MKARIQQLKTRWQNYSPRERQLFKICAGALGCAIIYYGAMLPLDNIIQINQSALNKQQHTLSWMRDEINKNHLQAKVLKVTNPRSVVEESAKIVHLSLSDVRQEDQSLSFSIGRVNVYTLKSWLREINLTSGVRLEKIELTPVDHLSDVNAHITLSWAKTA